MIALLLIASLKGIKSQQPFHSGSFCRHRKKKGTALCMNSIFLTCLLCFFAQLCAFQSQSALHSRRSPGKQKGNICRKPNFRAFPTTWSLLPAVAQGSIWPHSGGKAARRFHWKCSDCVADALPPKWLIWKDTAPKSCFGFRDPLLSQCSVGYGPIQSY